MPTSIRWNIGQFYVRFSWGELAYTLTHMIWKWWLMKHTVSGPGSTLSPRDIHISLPLPCTLSVWNTMKVSVRGWRGGGGYGGPILRGFDVHFPLEISGHTEWWFRSPLHWCHTPPPEHLGPTHLPLRQPQQMQPSISTENLTVKGHWHNRRARGSHPTNGWILPLFIEIPPQSFV